METSITFMDCRDCPHRKSIRGQGECWEECGHPDRRVGIYENILWGCQEQFKSVPAYCPIKKPLTMTATIGDEL